MSTQNNIPTWYWIVSAIALLWNLSGLAAFFMEITMNAETLAMLPVEEQQLYSEIPVWVNVAFGVAVVGGTLGCIALLMKKKLAYEIFIISLIGIALQMGYNIFLSSAMDVYGAEALIMPLMVSIIAIALLIFTKNAISKGWVS